MKLLHSLNAGPARGAAFSHGSAVHSMKLLQRDPAGRPPTQPQAGVW